MFKKIRKKQNVICYMLYIHVYPLVEHMETHFDTEPLLEETSQYSINTHKHIMD